MSEIKHFNTTFKGINMYHLPIVTRVFIDTFMFNAERVKAEQKINRVKT